MMSFTPLSLYPHGRAFGYALYKRWASEPVWTLWSREKYLAPDGNRTPAIEYVAHRYAD
jgi:hypothetical protein